MDQPKCMSPAKPCHASHKSAALEVQTEHNHKLFQVSGVWGAESLLMLA